MHIKKLYISKVFKVFLRLKHFYKIFSWLITIATIWNLKNLMIVFSTKQATV